MYIRCIYFPHNYSAYPAPSGIPGPLSFSDVNLTSITVQWTELPCSDRNGEIIGYTVEYNSTRPPHSIIVRVLGPSTTRLVVVGLLPRTNYTFSVRAAGARGLMGPSARESNFTSTPSGLLAVNMFGFIDIYVCSSWLFSQWSFSP